MDSFFDIKPYVDDCVHSFSYDIGQKKFTYDTRLQAAIRDSFESIGSKSMINHFNKAKRDHRQPAYMNDSVYAKARQHWSSESHQRISNINRANRLNERVGQGPCTHAAGSRSTTKRIMLLVNIFSHSNFNSF